MIQFQAKYLPALISFMAKNGIRYYLNGINIRPHADGGVVLAATDGHRMLVIRDIEGYCAEDTTFKIDPGVARFCKKPDAVVSVNPYTQRLIISGREGELFVQPGRCIVEGKFPDYTKVMPTFSKLKLAVADHVRSNYLVEAASIHPDFSSKRFGVTNGIRLWQAEANGSVIVEYAGHPEYCGIIMPVRCDVIDALGAWRKQFGQAEIPGLSEAA